MVTQSEYWGALRTLLFPVRCVMCRVPLWDGGGLGGLCPDCRQGVFRLESPLCVSCGRPLYELDEALVAHVSRAADELLCWRCEKQPVYFRHARSLYAYAGGLRELVHRYKYQLHLPAGVALQTFFAEGCMHLEWDWGQYTYVAPVPVSNKRLRMRGFNQSWALVESIPTLCLHQREPALLRRREDAPSQALLSAQERFENILGAIEVCSDFVGSLEGATILLVDDLFTTGATAQACARALCDVGAQAVDVLTLCRGIL